MGRARNSHAAAAVAADQFDSVFGGRRGRSDVDLIQNKSPGAEARRDALELAVPERRDELVALLAHYHADLDERPLLVQMRKDLVAQLHDEGFKSSLKPAHQAFKALGVASVLSDVVVGTERGKLHVWADGAKVGPLFTASINDVGPLFDSNSKDLHGKTLCGVKLVEPMQSNSLGIRRRSHGDWNVYPERRCSKCEAKSEGIDELRKEPGEPAPLPPRYLDIARADALTRLEKTIKLQLGMGGRTYADLQAQVPRAAAHALLKAAGQRQADRGPYAIASLGPAVDGWTKTVSDITGEKEQLLFCQVVEKYPVTLPATMWEKLLALQAPLTVDGEFEHLDISDEGREKFWKKAHRLGADALRRDYPF